MDRLIFTANTAMSEYRLDRQNLTHELANVSTVGFKKAFQVANRTVRTEGEGFDTRFLPRAFTSPLVDLTEGHLMVTGKSLDVAMREKTVLPVRADNGDVAWTRRGDLQIDAEGFLRTGEGFPVLDDALSEIQLPVGFAEFNIIEDGSVTAFDPNVPEAGTTTIAVLGIKDATGVDLGRRPDGLFQAMNATKHRQDFQAGIGVASVTSGALEGSNVSSIHSLVKFIDHQRSFEMQTKMIKTAKDNDSNGAAMMRAQ